MTEEQIIEVEKLSRGFLAPAEICLILGLRYEEYNEAFITKDLQNDFYRSYQKGKLMRQYELNIISLEQAIAGSAPAQEICLKNSEQQIANEG